MSQGASGITGIPNGRVRCRSAGGRRGYHLLTMAPHSLGVRRLHPIGGESLRVVRSPTRVRRIIRVTLFVLLGGIAAIAVLWRATAITSEPVEIQRLPNGSFVLVTRPIAPATRAEAAANFPRRVPLVTVGVDGARTPGIEVPAEGTAFPIPLAVGVRRSRPILQMGGFETTHAEPGSVPSIVRDVPFWVGDHEAANDVGLIGRVKQWMKSL